MEGLGTRRTWQTEATRRRALPPILYRAQALALGFLLVAALLVVPAAPGYAAWSGARGGRGGVVRGGAPAAGWQGGAPPSGSRGGAPPPGGSHGGAPPSGWHGGVPPSGWHGGAPPSGWHGGVPPGGWHGGAPPPAWHGGGWYGGWYGGGAVIVGGPWWWGYPYGYGYPYPYYYPYPYAVPYPAYPPVVDQGPSVYIEKPMGSPEGAAAGYWYYCPSSKEYYPKVQTCSDPWVKVPPRPQ